ncbi:prepilin peptidase [Glutamicibacter ardleyensis]|uniref:prepilin peptidase n=1 Tax=Glutamicibacter ardleyensis TaxID=225894 RepID=UPI003FD1EF8D
MTSEALTIRIKLNPTMLFSLAFSCITSALVSPALVVFGNIVPSSSHGASLTYVLLAVVGGFLGVLTVWDTVTRRIPNNMIIGFSLILVPLVIALVASTGAWGTLGLSTLISSAWFALSLAYAVIQPKSLGGGDLKVMPLIMLPLGLISLWLPVVWAIVSVVFASIHSLAQRAKGDGSVPFAPSMNVALPTAIGIFALFQGATNILST